MNQTAQASTPAKAPKPLTELEKRIKTLQKLKSDGKANAEQLKELEEAKQKQSNLDLRRLAGARVNKVVDTLRTIGNLARLKPTEKQTEQVFSAIKEAVDECYIKWQGNTAKDKEDFSLSE